MAGRRTVRIAVGVGALLLFGPSGPTVGGAGALSGVPRPVAPGALGAVRQTGPVFAQAQARASVDVIALQGELARVQMADAADRQKAADDDARLGERISAAGAAATAASQARDEARAGVEERSRRIGELDARVRAARSDREAKRRRFSAYLAASWADGGVSGQSQSDSWIVFSRTDPEPELRRRELGRSAGNAVRGHLEDAGARVEKLLADRQAAVGEREMLAAEVDRQGAILAGQLGTRADADAERQRAAEDEARRSFLETARIQDLKMKIVRAQQNVDKFTLLALESDSPILGQPVLDEVDLARWFLATRPPARLTVPLTELAKIYVEEGRAEGVRSDVAFAQAILETGSFGYPIFGQVRPGDNNYAGIGACDSCSNGFGFADARTGVRAQIQLLKVYATPGLLSTGFANPSVRWRPESMGIRGCCPTWGRLAGVWATSTSYFSGIDSVWSSLATWVATDYVKNGPLGVDPTAEDTVLYVSGSSDGGVAGSRGRSSSSTTVPTGGLNAPTSSGVPTTAVSGELPGTAPPLGTTTVAPTAPPATTPGPTPTT